MRQRSTRFIRSHASCQRNGSLAKGKPSNLHKSPEFRPRLRAQRQRALFPFKTGRRTASSQEIIMKFPAFLLALAAAFAPIAPVLAAQNDSRMIEIYHIAPGKHVEFLKLIALYDEANRQAGLPPRELYVHSDGGSWDFLLI